MVKITQNSKDKVCFQISLELSPPTHRVVNYKTICVYCFNKLHNSFLKNCD